MGGKVVVVDDDLVIRKTMVAILQTDGHEVIEACDAAEGLQAIRSSQPDLVFVDWMMPGGDGCQLALDIRSDTSLAAQPYIVLLTAAAENTDPLKVTEARIDRVISKPFSPGQVLDLASEIVGNRS